MFAKAGARVIGICSRTISELEMTKTEIRQINPEVDVYMQKADVANEGDVKSFFQGLSNQGGGAVDVLVSNAGANSCFEPTLATSTDLWWHDVVSVLCSWSGLHLLTAVERKPQGHISHGKVLRAAA
jgi:NAD(P)-dependent dehydrogenase (short-subunit alcohol dehydrogenase family)